MFSQWFFANKKIAIIASTALNLYDVQTTWWPNIFRVTFDVIHHAISWQHALIGIVYLKRRHNLVLNISQTVVGLARRLKLLIYLPLPSKSLTFISGICVNLQSFSLCIWLLKMFKNHRESILTRTTQYHSAQISLAKTAHHSNIFGSSTT